MLLSVDVTTFFLLIKSFSAILLTVSSFNTHHQMPQ